MNYNDRAAAVITLENKVGQVTKSYGVKGELIVKLWDNFPQSIKEQNFEEPLWMSIDSIATPFFVCSFRGQGSSKAVVELEDITSGQLAGMVIGRDIYAHVVDILDDTMGSDLDYLIGFSFHDVTSGRGGIVSGVIDSAFNPLIEVIIDGDEVLVPIAEALIAKLSRRKRLLRMRLPHEFFGTDEHGRSF